MKSYHNDPNKTDKSGFSINECIERLRHVDDCDDEVILDDKTVDEFSHEKLFNAIELIRKMEPVLKSIGSPDRHPLSGMHICCNFDEAEIALSTHVPETAKWTKRFNHLSKIFREIWGFDAPDFHHQEDDLVLLNDLIKHKADTNRRCSIITNENISKLASTINSLDEKSLQAAIEINDQIIEANRNINFHFGKYWKFLSGYGGDLGELSQQWAANLSSLKEWIIFRKQLIELAELVGNDCWEQLSHSDPVNHTIKALQKGFYRAKLSRLNSLKCQVSQNQ